MSSLYELTENMLQVEQMLEQGLIEEADDTLESLQGDWEAKAEDIVKLMRSLTADAESYAREAEYYETKAKNAKSQAQHLQDYLYRSMKSLNKDKATAGNFKLVIAKNGGKLKLHIDSPSKLPMAYRKLSYVPDNDKIRAALDGGAKIDGVYYEERGESLRIK